MRRASDRTSILRDLKRFEVLLIATIAICSDFCRLHHSPKYVFRDNGSTHGSPRSGQFIAWRKHILGIVNEKSQPITLKLSGKVIKNRMYRTPLSEYASTYDENNVENCGKPLPRYAELYQGMTIILPFLTQFQIEEIDS
jgi:hypothetical protein